MEKSEEIMALTKPHGGTEQDTKENKTDFG